MNRISKSSALRLIVAAGLAATVATGIAIASGAQRTTITLKITGEATRALNLNNISSPLVKDYSLLLASGTGANQASAVFADQRTLTASSTENLDLAGSLTNAFGQTLTFTKIKAIIIYAAAGNTNNVQVGGAASNGFVNWVADATDIVNVRPGGTLILVAPDATAYGVTAATGDILKVTNSSSGTSVTYDVVIIGVD